LHTLDFESSAQYTFLMICNNLKISEVLSQNIKSLREAHGLTLEELGEKLGISKQAMWSIENEKSWITLKNVEKLSEFFHVEQDFLFQKRKS
jgi:transcriptional regulator with XRE-family HTH domain